MMLDVQNDLLWFVAIAVLVLLAAFFAASEGALISISRLRALSMQEKGLPRARDVLMLVEDRQRFLTTVLVANTLVLLGAESLATWLAIELGIPQAALVATLVMALLVLLFGEIIPKTIAVADSERWAVRLAMPMRAVAWLLSPFVRLMLWITVFMLRPFGVDRRTSLFVTEEDIRTLVDVGAEQRVIEEEEREMIHSVIEFGDTIVREVMTPRPSMIAISVEESSRRALDVVIAEGYSKLPVFEESRDDIVGVVHDRELLVALANGTLAQQSLRVFMRPAVHVPETKKIAELLREMQRDKFSMAIVVDEYGGTAGIVTMEDLLEEIVGEIRDEHDEDEQEPIHVVGEGEAIVEAATNIEDVNAKLGTDLPTEEFETIGGYTVGLFGRLPGEGEEVVADPETRLRVDRLRRRRILAVRVFYNGRTESERTDDALV